MEYKKSQRTKTEAEVEPQEKLENSKEFQERKDSLLSSIDVADEKNIV